MKYEYKDLPNFILNKDGMYELFDYSRVLVPIPENKEDQEYLEE